MNIRRATCNDIDQINALLYQVLTVHHNGRPDLFRENAKKYTDEELKTILTDDKTPVFVAVSYTHLGIAHTAGIICQLKRKRSLQCEDSALPLQ